MLFHISLIIFVSRTYSNEMKGVYSSADSLLNRASQRSLFVDNTYSVDSGGDPAVIPNLSFEQFKAFHEKFYHPSNSRIYFAGDDDVYKRLELMDEYLRDFDASEDYKEKSKVKWQTKKFDAPIREKQTYPAGADQEATNMFMMNWLINDRPLTPTEDLTLAVLDHLLMGTTSSILRKTLMESGLGEAITGGGLSDELLQATYSVGLKGVKEENMENAEQLILDTLAKVEKEGFTADDIEASLNTIEFQMREFNTGSFPRYLSFMLAANSKWVYDESPLLGLKFEKPLAELKSTIAATGFKVFSDMVREFLVQNTHRTTVELVPSKTMEEELLQEEADRLAAIQFKLSPGELAKIVLTAAELKKRQAADDPPEARATIPSLKLSDLKRETTNYPIEVTSNENGTGVTVVRHKLGSTSGIAYVNFAVDLSRLSLDEASLLPLFTQVMMETGAGDLDSVALSRKIGTHTGGVDVNLLTTAVYPKGVDESVVTKGENLVTKLMVQGKATSKKIDELFSIFHLVLTDAKLDSQSKVIEMLREKKSRLESRIQGSGHSFASARMKARYRVGGYVDEMLGGITYLDTVKSLLKEAEEDWPSLLARLEKIRATLLDTSTCRNGMILDVTGDDAVLSAIQSSINKFLDSLPGDNQGTKLCDFYSEPHPWVPEIKKRMAEFAPIKDEGFVVPTQVSYVGKSGLLYEEGERIPGSATVVARFLRTGYLWDRVRVMGGAYGGFCSLSAFSGLISFFSYRDPNLDKTLDVYDLAADDLLAAAEALENDPDALTTAIIGAVGDLDGALSPDQKGYQAFTHWITNQSPEYRQKFRDEILNTKPSDFRDFAERLRSMKDPSVAVVSSKGAFESASKAGKVMTLRELL
jgi:presequence protease